MLSALALQKLRTNALTNVPVEHREFGVDGRGGSLAGGVDQLAYVCQERIDLWNQIAHAKPPACMIASTPLIFTLPVVYVEQLPPRYRSPGTEVPVQICRAPGVRPKHRGME